MATPRQEKLGKALIENVLSDKPKTLKELVVSSGYDETTAIKQVPAVINQKGVQEVIKRETDLMLDALKKKGVTSEYVADRIKVLLDAKKIIKVAGKDGEMQIISEEDNYQAIDKGISHVAKFGLGGGYKTNDDGVSTQQNIQVNIFNTPEVKEIVADFEAKLKEQLSKQPPTNV